MDTAQYPTSTFKLTQPIDLGSVPADGKTITAKATGDLTLHGTTKSVTFEVEAREDRLRHRGRGPDPDRVRRLPDPEPDVRSGQHR